MTTFRIRLLELIQENNGQVNWYQLDRAISSETAQREEHLLNSLKELESAGFILSNSGPNPAQPTHCITDVGTIFLRTKKNEKA